MLAFARSAWEDEVDPDALACPQTSARVAEVKDVSAQQHAELTILPDGARFEAGALVFTRGAKPAVVGAWNFRNRVPLDRRVTLGVRFDLEVELEQSVPNATEWSLVPWFVGRRSKWGGTSARLKAAAGSQNADLAKAMQDSVGLPKDKFAPVPGPNAELNLRALRKDGKFLFYALNPAPWPVKAVRQIDRAGQLVNSGFTAALALPAALVAALGLARQSAGGVVLADGSVRQFAIYAVEVDCDGVWRPVLMSAVSDEVWLGMRLMANHKLRIAVVPGGAVALTPLP